MPRSKNMNQTPTSLNNNNQIIPGTVPDLSKTLSQIVELQPQFRGQKYLALEGGNVLSRKKVYLTAGTTFWGQTAH